MPTYDRDNPKQFSRIGDVIPDMGRSRITLVCPFCEEDFTAFLWSLAGSGKKCPSCGALHTSWGYAYKQIKR